MRPPLLLTLWTVRVACVLYVLALAAWLTRKGQCARLLWTFSFACYLGHVASAFAFQYHWSHHTAYEETARHTAELFKVRWGGGLYFNYLFTALWALDVIWIWWNTGNYRKRPRWINVVLHSFLAFMFFNATVVFASGAVRWLGLTAVLVLGGLWYRTQPIDKVQIH